MSFWVDLDLPDRIVNYKPHPILCSNEPFCFYCRYFHSFWEWRTLRIFTAQISISLIFERIFEQILFGFIIAIFLLRQIWQFARISWKRMNKTESLSDPKPQVSFITWPRYTMGLFALQVSISWHPCIKSLIQI